MSQVDMIDRLIDEAQEQRIAAVAIGDEAGASFYDSMIFRLTDALRVEMEYDGDA